jgi:hypothetical protein
MKHSNPIVLTPAGISNVTSPELPKAESPILVTVSGISTVVNFEQVWNVELGIDVIFARETFTNLVQFANTLIPVRCGVLMSIVCNEPFHEKQ